MLKTTRKTMANIAQFVDRLEMDCIKNQDAMIEKAMNLQIFKDIDWNSAKWDVTESFRHKIRVSETRKNKYLNFYRVIPFQDFNMETRYTNLVKAMTVLRYHIGGQSAANLQSFIDGWRFLHEALEKYNHRLELVNVEVLNDACKIAEENVGEGTSYNRVKAITEIANLIDRNKLAKINLAFNYHRKSRPENVSGIKFKRLDDKSILETHNPKMVEENVLRAIGTLYRSIPEYEHADRLRILLVTLSVFLGRRIGEVLTMPAIPLQRNENNIAYLTYYPQKKSLGDLILVKEVLYIPNSIVELIEKVINEILEITKITRETAKYIEKNKHADYRMLEPYLEKGWMSSSDIEECFDISHKNGRGWANHRNLVSEPRPDHHNPRTVCWAISEIKRGMNQDVILKPSLVATDAQLYPSDLLGVIFLNACHSEKSTLKYAVRVIDWQQYSDFLGSNMSRRQNKDGILMIKSVFDKYIQGEDSIRLSVNSHAFRHTLNTWLDEGGMSDALQTKWFGRKNPSDTKAYQHTSPEKRALLVIKDLLDAKISGPVNDQIKFLPVSSKEAFLKARVKAVHDVGPGLCFHDFSQTPCERSLKCSANCNDYHWVNNDLGRLEEIKRQYSITWRSNQRAEESVKSGRAISQRWLEQNHQMIETYKSQLKSMGITDFDPEAYTKELSS